MNAADEVLGRALGFADEGDFQAMAEELRAALVDYADDPHVLCWLGVAERELGMEGVAYERFKRCLAMGPEDPVILATAGSAIALFDDPEAEPALRTAAMLGPDVLVARLMYGAYLAREGHVDQALRELDDARALAPDDAAVALERGVALAIAERTTEAVDELARAATLDPDDGWSAILLGLALVDLDRPDEAATDLARGATLRPEDVEAQVLTALAAMAAGWEDTAFEMLERGRMWAQGADLPLVAVAEDAIEDGPEASLDALRSTVAPSAFRSRLMTRP